MCLEAYNFFSSGISFATILIKPAKQPTVPQTGSSHMFYSITAFGKGAGDVLSHDEIIVFLRNAYDRWIDFENDKKEKIK
jgi:hypothetical protein